MQFGGCAFNTPISGTSIYESISSDVLHTTLSPVTTTILTGKYTIIIHSVVLCLDIESTIDSTSSGTCICIYILYN